MYPAIKAALPKYEITSSIATKIRDVPYSCGGSGVLSLYHYQCTSRTPMILEYLNRSMSTSHLAKIYLKDLILDIGLYGNLVDMKFTQFKK